MAGSLILFETLAPGCAMLMRPNKAETAVLIGCTTLCAWPNRGDGRVTIAFKRVTTSTKAMIIESKENIQ